MKEEKVCYQYTCPKYPDCARARGACCAVEREDSQVLVEEQECQKETGYPFFQQKDTALRDWMRGKIQ